MLGEVSSRDPSEGSQRLHEAIGVRSTISKASSPILSIFWLIREPFILTRMYDNYYLVDDSEKNSSQKNVVNENTENIWRALLQLVGSKRKCLSLTPCFFIKNFNRN